MTPYPQKAEFIKNEFSKSAFSWEDHNKHYMFRPPQVNKKRNSESIRDPNVIRSMVNKYRKVHSYKEFNITSLLKPPHNTEPTQISTKGNWKKIKVK